MGKDDRVDAPVRGMKVGFVGLGKMGWPMARHLAQAGAELIAMDIDQSRAEEFAEQHGGRAAATLADIAKADIVILMLPSSNEVEDVLLGDDGLGARMQAGSLIIDCSSSDSARTRAVAASLANHSIEMVDAPVAGGVVFAEDGTLDVLVGGCSSAIERAQPVLECFAKSITPCGNIGTAHAMKVINNFVNAQALITYAEALSMALKSDVALETAVASLGNATTGRNHPFEKKIVQQVLTGKFSAGAALAIIEKDVALAAQLAADYDLEAPIVRQCSALWTRGAQEIGANVDQTEIVRLWEKDADVVMRRGR